MRIISKRTLQDYAENYPDAAVQLEAWHKIAKASTWTSPHDVKSLFRNASIAGNTRVVFNICGNNYRLTVAMNYCLGICYIRFFGSHANYDKIDAETV